METEVSFSVQKKKINHQLTTYFAMWTEPLYYSSLQAKASEQQESL